MDLSLFLVHESREHVVEVVCTNFASRGKSSAIVEPRADAALDGFDNFFVFHLDFVKATANTLFTQ